MPGNCTPMAVKIVPVSQDSSLQQLFWSSQRILKWLFMTSLHNFSSRGAAQLHGHPHAVAFRGQTASACIPHLQARGSANGFCHSAATEGHGQGG
eukprot:scaffold156767_cov17-Tisochrysis_lutea.AAC.1